MKKYAMPAIMLAVFETVAVTLWLTKGNVFYLFNFSYIGISISLGIFLYITPPTAPAQVFLGDSLGHILFACPLRILLYVIPTRYAKVSEAGEMTKISNSAIKPPPSSFAESIVKSNNAG